MAFDPLRDFVPVRTAAYPASRTGIWLAWSGPAAILEAVISGLSHAGGVRCRDRSRLRKVRQVAKDFAIKLE
jgi:hypothetical protein